MSATVPRAHNECPPFLLSDGKKCMYFVWDIYINYEFTLANLHFETNLHLLMDIDEMKATFSPLVRSRSGLVR